MDLSTFQLVDAINDMDMLRNLSDQQQQPEQYGQRQHSNNNNNSAYNQLHGDIDLLFQPDQINSSPQHDMNPYISYKNVNSSMGNQSNQMMASPHYNNHRQNDCYEQEDILTPLISPAMTPSFSYQVHQHKNHKSMNFNSNNNDMDFSPLSSPAILPQVDRQGNQQQFSRTSFQDQLASSVVYNNNSSNNKPNGDSYEKMSATQICEQYEQLENAKLLITQKLSQLQKSQQRFNQYDDQDYQRDLRLSESNSSKRSNTTKSKSDGTSIMQQHVNTDHMSIHHPNAMSKPSSPHISPHMEPATPASLMNMKMNSNNVSKHQFSSSGRAQQFFSSSTTIMTSSANMNNYNRSKSISISSGPIFQSPILNTAPIHESNLIVSPMIAPTTNSTATVNATETTTIISSINNHTGPLSPLALHPRNNKSRSSNLKEKAGLRFSKKQRKESTDSKIVNGIHASPRALKPLLISPTLNPGIKPLPNSIVPTRTVHSVEDAERILATQSNYQNLMEGKGAALGIAFSTQIKSGLEVRRTAHKAAEQKRRDSLKQWFDRLRREVEDGYVKQQKTVMSQIIKAQEMEKNSNKNMSNTTDDEMEDTSTADANVMKPLSKVLLLQYAYEYISSLKNTLKERDSTIEALLSGTDKNIVRLKRRQDNEDEDDDDMVEGLYNDSI